MRRTAKDWLDRPMTSWHLITGIFVLLLGFGLLMMLSASSIVSFHKQGSPFAAFENQAMFAGLGVVAFIFASRLSTRVMRTYSLPLVGFCVFLLAAVLVIGSKAGGARSWINLHGFTFQPSEVAKLALLIWMGDVLAARRNTLRSIRSLLFPVLPVFVLMVGLIMLEPDLGTTVTLGLIFIAVLWFGGAPWWMFALLTAGAGGAMYYLATSAGYRNLRILTWLHPDQASADAVLQINQSLYALGHGGLFGAGLGQAMSKSGWLPNADSDFIFAVIGEELGLVGAGLLLVLYALLAYTGLRIARRNVDPFIKIVASGATVWLVGQAAINIGYVIGLLPVTGIPLPMISRGGTSLVITMVVFGMLANFARREPQAAAALHSQGPGRVARFLGLGPRPPKPPKVRKARPAKPSKTSTRPAAGRAVRGQGERASQRAEGRPVGERPLPTGAASGRGGADSGRNRSDSVRGRPDSGRGRADAGRRDADATTRGSDGSRRRDRAVPDDRAVDRPVAGGRDADRSDSPKRSRREQRRDDSTARSTPGQQPPRLRRSGDVDSTGPVTDWAGRAFVEPPRPGARGGRSDGRSAPGSDGRGAPRSDGRAPDHDRRPRPSGQRGDGARPGPPGAGRTGGRGRTMRP